MERRPRALLVGPVYPVYRAGGLQLALNDVADQLRARGWDVDAPLVAGDVDDVEAAPPAATSIRSRLGALQRWAWLMRLRNLALGIAGTGGVFFKPRAFLVNASRNLYWLEKRLAAAPPYDIVLVCVDDSAPGMIRLATERHPCCVVISLLGLAAELGESRSLWRRALAWASVGGSAHPYLLRSVSPKQIRLAIFASRDWQNRAVAAGLPEANAQTIYFGVPQPLSLPRPDRQARRLLWVGRLSAEKGLLLLLEALPSIRARHREVTLTVVADEGPRAYRGQVHAAIRRLKLDEVVTIRATMPRAALQSLYSQHDVLFFHSVYRDPVALVLMEAYAAGLPTVASRASPGARLVKDGETCLCYEPGNSASVADAVVRILEDGELLTRLASTAQALVRCEFSLEAMGQAYDEALRRTLSCVQVRAHP